MEKKINITSTALEKGIDTAKNFLDKLIMPAVEETGLLLKDQVTMWKFKNQVKMLNKAKKYCEANNIAPKQISLKLLCPLLEYAGIEEDDELQDKWAILLSNMVDSEQNVENHVFPYILSQLSRSEFLVLEDIYDIKQDRVTKAKIELEQHQADKPRIEALYQPKIEELKQKMNEIKNHSNEYWDLYRQLSALESELRSYQTKEWSLNHTIKQPAILPDEYLKNFELSNLIRLGLVKEEKEFYADSQTLEIPNDRDSYRSYTTIDLDIDVNSNVENILTELGELFIQACKEKSIDSTKE